MAFTGVSSTRVTSCYHNLLTVEAEERRSNLLLLKNECKEVEEETVTDKGLGCAAEQE